MLKLIHKADEPIEAPEIAKGITSLATAEDVDREPLMALLGCSDRNSQRWARRWLEQSGFEVRVVTSALEAQEILPTMEAPSVAILEAGIWERWGKYLYSSLPGRETDGACPAIVLCAKSREATRALSGGAADVARRPFNWQLIGRRAALLAQSVSSMVELERAREAIDRALAAAHSAREQLEQKADRDALTELPNRRVFGQLLDRALAVPRAVDSLAAVLVLDLDRFGSINESVGRNGGNALLTLIAGRLERCLHGHELLAARTSGLVSATVSRLGSDEFALMISNVASTAHVRKLAERILNALSDPFEVNGDSLHVSGSLGVACYPDDGQDQEALIRRAELAMIEAKGLGGGTVCFYDQSLNRKACRRVTLNRELRLALERDEFQLHFQPLINLKSHKLVAVEALLRWQHPTDGMIPPMAFVPEAEEEPGLMVAIGSWVLHTACRQLRTWMDEGLPPIRMAINISHCQLTRGDLLADISTALDESRIPPELLEFELSERGILGRSLEIVDLLRQLKTLGVRISVDDFGSGDSAIAYLKSLPIDVLKIDRSFVLGAPTSRDDAIIASAVVAMAHELNLQVVAEGIECQRHLELAREWGCDEIQGFLFAPPRPAEEFHRFVEGNRWVVPMSDEEIKC